MSYKTSPDPTIEYDPSANTAFCYVRPYTHDVGDDLCSVCWVNNACTAYQSAKMERMISMNNCNQERCDKCTLKSFCDHHRKKREETDAEERLEKFEDICEFMCDLYEDKNEDYGDSFHDTVKKYGLIAALTRMSDKFNRIENLIMLMSQGQKVKDETIKDTLMDLACYAIMTIMELDE